jgi:hypothetical protein
MLALLCIGRATICDNRHSNIVLSTRQGSAAHRRHRSSVSPVSFVSMFSFNLTRVFLPYRKGLCVCKVERLSPEVFILLGHACLIVISRLIPMLHFQAAINGHCIDDVHLIRRDKLVLSVVVFPSTTQVLRSVQPAQPDVNMLWVQRAHFQDFRFPLRARVDSWVFRLIVFDQNALACCDTFASNCVPLSVTSLHVVRLMA